MSQSGAGNELSKDILEELQKTGRENIASVYECARSRFHKKIVVLDDDPTGIQTVHDVSVFTDWDRESVEEGFREEADMFFILTNSRGMSRKRSAGVHREIAAAVSEVSEKLNRDFVIISRGDSTLRGHYPLETEVLKEEIEQKTGKQFDGEIIFPFFEEGGRFTINSVHYVCIGNTLVPVGDTEFARDRSFGYHASNLAEWCEEKSEGRFPAKDVIKITLDDLRKRSIGDITACLMQASHFRKIVVDAVCEADVKTFMTAYLGAVENGKRFMFRSAAAVPKVLGNITNQPFLTKEELISGESRCGGLVVVGSHVRKTTAQLTALRQSRRPLTFIEFYAEAVTRPGGLLEEARRVTALAEQEISVGKTVVVYTSRTVVKTNTEDKDKILETSVRISEAISEVVGSLTVRPGFILAKGGITSSDVGTKALRVKKARVMGQIKPGVSVWKTGPESKFSELPYIIFPGNVGDDETLRETVEMLL